MKEPEWTALPAVAAVTRDGRFLINTVLPDTASPITLIQNWKPQGDARSWRVGGLVSW